jgi:23S rRNA (cytosine1962-C5)-methyltransferase
MICLTVRPMLDMLENLLPPALEARVGLFDERREAAFRLFNGFTEGWPALAIDLYARTLVIHDYREAASEEGSDPIAVARDLCRARLPWIDATIVKRRREIDPKLRNGELIDGEQPARKVREHGVWYAVDLMLNRDASLYLDTRNLRRWALDHLKGRRVLNTFAYTGSLGVAAMAAGASRVVQLDLNRAFLNLAKTSYTFNGFPIHKQDFLSGDFWPMISRLNSAGERFDCVFLDPPFFAKTKKGVIDMENNYGRLINKIRPLIADGGMLVAVNNSLYVSGADFMATLEPLTADGYLAIEELIPVAEDFTGYEKTRVAAGVTNPAPFNHATKIAVLRVRRKDAMQTS